MVATSLFLMDPDLSNSVYEMTGSQLAKIDEIEEGFRSLLELLTCGAYWDVRFPIFRPDAPILALAGLGDSGRTDIAEEHDKFIYRVDQ